MGDIQVLFLNGGVINTTMKVTFKRNFILELKYNTIFTEQNRTDLVFLILQ